MAKNILYLLIIIAAFFIILFNNQLNIIVKIIALVTMIFGAWIMMDAIIRQIHDKKNK